MMNELMNGGANFQFPVINIFIVDKLTLSGVRFKVGVEGTVLCGKSDHSMTCDLLIGFFSTFLFPGLIASPGI